MRDVDAGVSKTETSTTPTSTTESVSVSTPSKSTDSSDSSDDSASFGSDGRANHINSPSPSAALFDDLVPPFVFNCSYYFTENECRKGDPRRSYVDRYHYANTTNIYLFVVNHHWDKFSGLNFFRAVYFPRFSRLFKYSFDVVYLAPHCFPEQRVCAHGLRVGGEYSYYTLSIGYQLFHGIQPYQYAGFFLLNDDGFLDPLYLNEYDLSKSHHEPTRKFNPKAVWSWSMMKNEHGTPYLKALVHAVNETISIPALENRCHLSDDQNIRRSLQDYFYVVREDIPLFLTLSSIFYKHRVFLEQAAPTINWCISKNVINTCNHHFWPNVTTCVHLHPVKLGHLSQQFLVMNHINRRDMTAKAAMSW